MPVEKLNYKQRDMITKANAKFKPVLVSCNILDSMVQNFFPTTCEIGEISNLVQDFLDGIILSNETSYGHHPIECI